MLRTRIYVDGYNLYYGCLKKDPSLRWLDPLALFENCVLPSISNNGGGSQLDQLAIKFFTAPILETAASASDSVKSQEQYHSALAKHNPGRIELIKGYYSLTEARAKIIDGKKLPRDCSVIPVWKLEEKQSDVSLALHAFKDALLDGIEQIVIVTNDTDIVPALEMIRAHTTAVIGLVVPTTDKERMANTDLEKLAHWTRHTIHVLELQASQFPRVVASQHRRPAHKPDSWYAYPDVLKRALELGSAKLGTRGKTFNWLVRPNPHYGDRTPLELIETGDGDQVIQFMESEAIPKPAL